jgi:hypothetical protein
LPDFGHVRLIKLECTKIDVEKTPNGAGGSVGARLRKARLSKGYSLEDLAIATGLTGAEIEDGNSSDGQHALR